MLAVLVMVMVVVLAAGWLLARVLSCRSNKRCCAHYFRMSLLLSSSLPLLTAAAVAIAVVAVVVVRQFDATCSDCCNSCRTSMRVCIAVRVPAGPSVRVCVVMARRREAVHLPSRAIAHRTVQIARRRMPQ